MEKEYRISKLKEIPNNPFRKTMATWYPNTKKLYKIAKNWKEIVGDVNAQNTQLLGVFKEGILSVACRSSVWSHALRQLKPAIIEKINNKFGNDYITDIIFSTSKYNKQAKRENSEKKEEISFENIQLSKSQLEEIEEKIKKFEDSPLKNKIRETYINLVKSEYSKQKNRK